MFFFIKQQIMMLNKLEFLANKLDTIIFKK